MTRRTKIIMSAIVVLPILLSIIVFGWAEYQRSTTSRTLSSFSVPEKWTLVEEKETGNVLCLDICIGKFKKFDVGNSTVSINQLKSIAMQNEFEVNSIDKKCELPEKTFGDVRYCSVSSKKENLKLGLSYYPKSDPRQDDDSQSIVDYVTLSIRFE